MSTVGHLFVGAAASRWALPPKSGLREVAFAVLLIGSTILPDIDLILWPTAWLPSSLTLAHRGATHSLLVALMVVVIVTVLARAVGLPARRVAIGASVAIGSHAILDSLTAGPGVAWLWPFTAMRFPTLPILPIAPLDDLFSMDGLILLLAEILVFSPFMAYAILARPIDPPPS